MVEAFVSSYWGKARAELGATCVWHPLAYHGLDVAAAGDAYLRLRPDIVSGVSRRVDVPEASVRNWLLFALAVHDLGKFADCFQAKWQRPGAASADRLFGSDPGHGRIGVALWAKQCDLSCDPSDGGFKHLHLHASHSTLLRPWVDAVFGHHGRPVEAPSAPLAQLMTPVSAGHARAFVEACAKVFPLDAPQAEPRRRESAFHETSWLVAGTAIVADWIGSNQSWFKYEPPEHDMAQYWAHAQRRAAVAVERAGLSRPPTKSTFVLKDALALPRPRGAEPRVI